MAYYYQVVSLARSEPDLQLLPCSTTKRLLWEQYPHAAADLAIGVSSHSNCDHYTGKWHK